jgi:sterol 24-C-methyltransferase
VEVAEPRSDPNLRQVWRYYDRTESRIGYKFLLGGTKHFGWYEPGQSKWRFATAMRQMEDVLADRLDLPADAEVLDAGCGIGDVARTMASKYGLKVTGIDILDFNIEVARRRSAASGLEKRTQFMWGDYHSLEFTDESFDGVYTMETLVHSANPEKVLTQFHRVLKPHGRLVMFEYSRTPADELTKDANAAFERVCTLAAMPTWFKMNHGDLERVMKKCGFSVESVTDITSRMLPMLRAFSVVGAVPYFLGRLFDVTPKVVNAMSGVEMWKQREAWRYNIYVATKA